MVDTQTANPVAEQHKEIAKETGAQLAVVSPPKAELVMGPAVQPIVPRTLDEVARMAQAVIVAGLAPDSYRGNSEKETASRIIIGILKGAEVGLPPITALSTIAIINGRPSIYGDGAIALCQSKGAIKSFEYNYTGTEGEDDYTCHVTIWRKGQDAPYVGEFSVKDAKRANLWMNPKKDPWVKYGKRMLFNRARAFPIRDGFADCLSGLAIAEEVMDLPSEPKVLESGVLDDAVETPEAPPQSTTPQAAE